MRKRSLEAIAESVRGRGHSRSSSRTALNYVVKIDDGQRIISGTMTNVSVDGVRITLEQPVAEGTRVKLIRGDSSAAALVRWADGLEIGAVLTEGADGRKR
jgi:hypothetical protein